MATKKVKIVSVSVDLMSEKGKLRTLERVVAEVDADKAAAFVKQANATESKNTGRVATAYKIAS